MKTSFLTTCFLACTCAMPCINPLSDRARLATTLSVDIACVAGMLAISYLTPKEASAPEGKEDMKYAFDIAGCCVGAPIIDPTLPLGKKSINIQLSYNSFSPLTALVAEGALAYCAQKEGVASRVVWEGIRTTSTALLYNMRNFLHGLVTGEAPTETGTKLFSSALGLARYIPSLVYDMQNNVYNWGMHDLIGAGTNLYVGIQTIRPFLPARHHVAAGNEDGQQPGQNQNPPMPPNANTHNR